MTVIDYGLGNLLSLTRVFQYLGMEVEMTNNPSTIASAERLVLGGVGAFPAGIKALQASGCDEAIKKFVATGRPFLGICLGMQLLFDSSEEHGKHLGLSIIPGEVLPIPLEDGKGKRRRIPHMGWSELQSNVPTDLLREISGKPTFYFVHSFMAAPKDKKHLLASARYEDLWIPALVKKENVIGTQFHPEKSGPHGLALLKNFLTDTISPRE